MRLGNYELFYCEEPAAYQKGNEPETTEYTSISKPLISMTTGVYGIRRDSVGYLRRGRENVRSGRQHDTNLRLKRRTPSILVIKTYVMAGSLAFPVAQCLQACHHTSARYVVQANNGLVAGCGRFGKGTKRRTPSKGICYRRQLYHRR